MPRLSLAGTLFPLFCAVAVIFLCSLFPPPAAALWEGGGKGWETDIGGSFRSVGALLQNYDEPALFGEGNDWDLLSQSIFRLTFEGTAGSALTWEVHLVQNFSWTDMGEGGGGGAAVGGRGAWRYRAVDGSWEWAGGDEAGAELSLDRLNVSYALGKADVTVGRQAIHFGEAYFWNPLDIFLPFNPESFDRDYKPGVDALRVDFALGDFSTFTVVAAPGREVSISSDDSGMTVGEVSFADEPWYGSALLGRLRTNAGAWDLTCQGGKVYGGWQGAIGFSGDAGPFGLRGEAAWFTPSEERKLLLPDEENPVGIREEDLFEENVAVVVGADHRFESSLHVSVEYLFNSAGGEDYALGLVRQAAGETLSLGRHLAGVEASYEIHPLVGGHLSWIYSFTDSSSLLSPVFTISLSDEAALIVGAFFAFGERPEVNEATGDLIVKDEYGSYPNTYLAEIKVYF